MCGGGRKGKESSPYRHCHSPSTAGVCHLDMVHPGLWWLVAVSSKGVPDVFA